MKIRYVSEDDLLALKGNSKDIFKKVVSKKKETIDLLFKSSDIFKDSNLEIQDFCLDMSQPKGRESLTDIENVMRVYNNMRSLSDSLASDERLWVAQTLFYNIDYMRYRWPAKSVKDMENHYFFNYSSQRSLFRNGISRLWWIGRISYDTNRDDPYELTKLLCRDQDYIESICGRNIFNNPDIGLTTLRALVDAEKNGIKIDRQTVRSISKYVNLLAGAYVVDTLSEKEIYEKLRAKLGF